MMESRMLAHGCLVLVDEGEALRHEVLDVDQSEQPALMVHDGQFVDRMPMLKRFFVGEAAGLTGELPRLLKGEPV